MFGIGSTELLVILLVGLIVLGPKSLAKVSRSIGKVIGEFRRVSTDFQRTLNAETAAEEQKEQMTKMSEQERKEKEQELAEDALRKEKLAARQKAAEEKAQEQKSKNAPPDSPLAQALAKTHADAQKSTNTQNPQA